MFVQKTAIAMMTAIGLAGCTGGDMIQNTDTKMTLVHYQWILDNATTVDGQRIDGLFVQAGKPLTLHLQDGELSVDNACNEIGGAYYLTGKTLTVGQLHTTMMACAEPAISQLDKLVVNYVQGVHDVMLQHGTPPTLTLKNNQATLSWRGEATLEAQYGQSETVFFSVAPQTVSCTSGVMQHDCLQVREVRYDAQGIKIYEDPEWTLLHTPIEGYSHRSGVADVIRVKRYQRANPPADASSVVYVYDTTVESILP